MELNLKGKVAIVTGGSKGIGKGIAASLLQEGATVVITARNADELEDTAAMFRLQGKDVLAVVADMTKEADLQRLVNTTVQQLGHIDILVNDIWGGELLKGGPPEWNKPLWDHDLDKGFRILRLAIDTHIITSRHLLPLLIDKPGGLLVEVTDGTTDYNASHYRISVFYDLAKVAVNRLAFSQGHELEPHGATAVALTPGWLRSEIMLDYFDIFQLIFVCRSRTTFDFSIRSINFFHCIMQGT